MSLFESTEWKEINRLGHSIYKMRKKAFNDIIKKYEDIDGGDVIDLNTLSVVEDKGYINNMEARPFAYASSYHISSEAKKRIRNLRGAQQKKKKSKSGTISDEDTAVKYKDFKMVSTAFMRQLKKQRLKEKFLDSPVKKHRDHRKKTISGPLKKRRKVDDNILKQFSCVHICEKESVEIDFLKLPSPGHKCDTPKQSKVTARGSNSGSDNELTPKRHNPMRATRTSTKKENLPLSCKNNTRKSCETHETNLKSSMASPLTNSSKLISPGRKRSTPILSKAEGSNTGTIDETTPKKHLEYVTREKKEILNLSCKNITPKSYEIQRRKLHSPSLTLSAKKLDGVEVDVLSNCNDSFSKIDLVPKSVKKTTKHIKCS